MQVSGRQVGMQAGERPKKAPHKKTCQNKEFKQFVWLSERIRLGGPSIRLELVARGNLIVLRITSTGSDFDNKPSYWAQTELTWDVPGPGSQNKSQSRRNARQAYGMNKAE